MAKKEAPAKTAEKVQSTEEYTLETEKTTAPPSRKKRIRKIAAIVLLLLLLIVGGLQKKHINDLTKDIKTNTATLQKKPEITKILTVQNQ